MKFVYNAILRIGRTMTRLCLSGQLPQDSGLTPLTATLVSAIA